MTTMKKIIVLLSIVLLSITGCSIRKLDDKNIDKNSANLDSVDLFIIATVTLLPLVYGVYCIWKLRRQKILVADRVQHIEQIRNRRKIR